MNFWFKLSLLPKVALCILFGIGIGYLRLTEPIRVLITMGDFFGNFLRFMVPLIIFMYVTASIADLGDGSTKLLGIAMGMSYTSTVIAGIAALFVMTALAPSILPIGSIDITKIADLESGALTGYFDIKIPPIMPVMTSLILAFVIGMTIANVKNSKVLPIVSEIGLSVTIVIDKIIIPLLPFYVMALFANLAYSRQVWQILQSFVTVFGVVLVVQWSLLFLLFILAGIVVKKNPIKLLLNMLPAYAAAVGTASSLATIPITIMGMKNNGVSEKVRNFVAPLCANIHMVGSMVEITATSVAVLVLTGQNVEFSRMLPFIFLLGVSTLAGPGVPGGPMIAALGILETSLGFGSELLALMVALDLAQDNFATGSNVAGDGAIALIVDKISENSSFSGSST